MPIDRTLIFKGPGHIAWDGAVIQSSADITVAVVKDPFDAYVSGFGRVDRRRAGMRVEVTATPARVSDLSKLWPYAATQIGQSIFGATDKPLSVIPRDGANSGFVVANAAITRLASLRLATRPDRGSPIGQLTWTGIVANNTDPASIANFLAVQAVGAVPNVALADLKSGRHTAVWGETFPAFESQTGFSVDFDLQLEPIATDNDGTVDMVLRSLEASCSVEPVGITTAQLLTAIGGVAPGGAEPKADLVITGAVGLTLANCICTQGQTRYGDTVQRFGQLQFTSVRKLTGTALDPLWVFA